MFPRPDPAIRKAADTLITHFTNNIGQPIRTPFYISQLEILYENDFFPWVIADAIKSLVKERFLVSFRKSDIPQNSTLPNIRDIVFVARSEPYRENPTLVKKHALSVAKLVNKYSAQKVTEALGKHFEGLVKAELRAQGFTIAGTHTNEYQGRKWINTNHNLDFIAEHKSGSLNIGVEVKNSLDLMEALEIDTKIDMCHFLGLVPVFAVRWIKAYIDCIRNQGGFSWMFKTQIYPPSFEKHTVELFRRLSFQERKNSREHPLQFPVTVRTEIPEKSQEAFRKWVDGAIVSSPQRNPGARCGRLTGTRIP